MAIGHENISAGSIHVPYNWTYADSTARGAASGFTPDDVGKLARQLDTNALYMLTDDSPVTWQSVGSAGSVDSVFGRSGTVTAQSGDYTATQITNTPAGNIAATTVQAALNELDGEKQPLDSDLTAIAGLSPSNDDVIQRKAGAWTNRTPTQLTADLIAMVGDSGSGGTKGLVPAPASGDATKFLRGDATWVSGGGSDLTAPPTSGSFTWRNQGGATVTDSSNIFVGAKKVTGWRLSAPTNSGDNLRILEINTPSTPYTITVSMLPIFLIQNHYSAGLCWVESGSDKVVDFGIASSGQAHLRATKWNGLSSFGSAYKDVAFDLHPIPLLWLRITDDGADRKCFYSPDGEGWILFHSVGRTDHLTPDKVGVMLNTNNTTDPSMLSLVHWVQS